MNLQDKIEKFQDRWRSIHRNDRLLKEAGRKYDYTIDDIEEIPSDKIERYGDVIVYPSPAFPGWFDVKVDGGTIVSFCGELAHRNAVVWAKRWGKS